MRAMANPRWSPSVTVAAMYAAAPQRDETPMHDAAAAALVSPVPAAPAVVEPFELPLDELRAIAVGAGLEWVNSDADKIHAAQMAMAAEPQSPRIPRERKPALVVDEGPLVLVETRKDLSQVKLPFEVTAPPP